MIAVNVALLRNRTTKIRNNLKPAETTQKLAETT